MKINIGSSAQNSLTNLLFVPVSNGFSPQDSARFFQCLFFLFMFSTPSQVSSFGGLRSVLPTVAARQVESIEQKFSTALSPSCSPALSLYSAPLSPSTDWPCLKCQSGLIADLRLLHLIRLAFHVCRGPLGEFGAPLQGPAALRSGSWCVFSSLVPTSPSALQPSSALQWCPAALHSHVGHHRCYDVKITKAKKLTL